MITRRGFFGVVASALAACKLAPKVEDRWEPITTALLERNTRTGALREPAMERYQALYREKQARIWHAYSHDFDMTWTDEEIVQRDHVRFRT